MSRYVEGGRLIFDLGMNNGDDTSHYLHRGFNVVALEANPTLCESAQKRFRAAIDDGRLTISCNLAKKRKRHLLRQFGQ